MGVLFEESGTNNRSNCSHQFDKNKQASCRHAGSFRCLSHTLCKLHKREARFTSNSTTLPCIEEHRLACRLTLSTRALLQDMVSLGLYKLLLTVLRVWHSKTISCCS